VIEHAEDVSLAAGAVMREGVTSARLGLRACLPRRIGLRGSDASFANFRARSAHRAFVGARVADRSLGKATRFTRDVRGNARTTSR